MSITIDREFGVQALIALVVTAGAWMMFVEPKAKELLTLEETIKAQATTNNQPSVSMDDLAAQASQVRTRISEIARRNSTALTSSDLYSKVGRLAEQHGMVVQTIRPGAEVEVDPKSTVQTVTIDLSVEGRYENAAEFLDAMSSIGGFVRPLTLTIVPQSRDGAQLVAVRYVCEVLQFKMPDALAAFMENRHGG